MDIKIQDLETEKKPIESSDDEVVEQKQVKPKHGRPKIHHDIEGSGTPYQYTKKARKNIREQKEELKKKEVELKQKEIQIQALEKIYNEEEVIKEKKQRKQKQEQPPPPPPQYQQQPIFYPDNSQEIQQLRLEIRQLHQQVQLKNEKRKKEVKELGFIIKSLNEQKDEKKNIKQEIKESKAENIEKKVEQVQQQIGQQQTLLQQFLQSQQKKEVKNDLFSILNKK